MRRSKRFSGGCVTTCGTPLNAIKGYSELLIEDLEADAEHPLRADLTKLKASADQLLGQIDAMTALARQETAEPAGAAKARQLDIVADVLRSLEPLPAGTAAQGPRHSSRILVVDDNASNRDLLVRRLSRDGHKVTRAERPGARSSSSRSRSSISFCSI